MPIIFHLKHTSLLWQILQFSLYEAELQNVWMLEATIPLELHDWFRSYGNVRWWVPNMCILPSGGVDTRRGSYTLGYHV